MILIMQFRRQWNTLRSHVFRIRGYNATDGVFVFWRGANTTCYYYKKGSLQPILKEIDKKWLLFVYTREVVFFKREKVWKERWRRVWIAWFINYKVYLIRWRQKVRNHSFILHSLQFHNNNNHARSPLVFIFIHLNQQFVYIFDVKKDNKTMNVWCVPFQIHSFNNNRTEQSHSFAIVIVSL